MHEDTGSKRVAPARDGAKSPSCISTASSAAPLVRSDSASSKSSAHSFNSSRSSQSSGSSCYSDPATAGSLGPRPASTHSPRPPPMVSAASIAAAQLQCQRQLQTGSPCLQQQATTASKTIKKPHAALMEHNTGHHWLSSSSSSAKTKHGRRCNNRLNDFLSSQLRNFNLAYLITILVCLVTILLLSRHNTSNSINNDATTSISAADSIVISKTTKHQHHARINNNKLASSDSMGATGDLSTSNSNGSSGAEEQLDSLDSQALVGSTSSNESVVDANSNDENNNNDKAGTSPVSSSGSGAAAPNTETNSSDTNSSDDSEDSMVDGFEQGNTFNTNNHQQTTASSHDSWTPKLRRKTMDSSMEAAPASMNGLESSRNPEQATFSAEQQMNSSSTSTTKNSDDALRHDLNYNNNNSSPPGKSSSQNHRAFSSTFVSGPSQQRITIMRNLNNNNNNNNPTAGSTNFEMTQSSSQPALSGLPIEPSSILSHIFNDLPMMPFAAPFSSGQMGNNNNNNNNLILKSVHSSPLMMMMMSAEPIGKSLIQDSSNLPINNNNNQTNESNKTNSTTSNKDNDNQIITHSQTFNNGNGKMVIRRDKNGATIVISSSSSSLSPSLFPMASPLASIFDNQREPMIPARVDPLSLMLNLISGGSSSAPNQQSAPLESRPIPQFQFQSSPPMSPFGGSFFSPLVLGPPPLTPSGLFGGPSLMASLMNEKEPQQNGNSTNSTTNSSAGELLSSPSSASSGGALFGPLVASSHPMAALGFGSSSGARFSESGDNGPYPLPLGRFAATIERVPVRSPQGFLFDGPNMNSASQFFRHASPSSPFGPLASFFGSARPLTAAFNGPPPGGLLSMLARASLSANESDMDAPEEDAEIMSARFEPAAKPAASFSANQTVAPHGSSSNQAKQQASPSNETLSTQTTNSTSITDASSSFKSQLERQDDSMESTSQFQETEPTPGFRMLSPPGLLFRSRLSPIGQGRSMLIVSSSSSPPGSSVSSVDNESPSGPSFGSSFPFGPMMMTASQADPLYPQAIMSTGAQHKFQSSPLIMMSSRSSSERDLSPGVSPLLRSILGNLMSSIGAHHQASHQRSRSGVNNKAVDVFADQQPKSTDQQSGGDDAKQSAFFSPSSISIDRSSWDEQPGMSSGSSNSAELDYDSDYEQAPFHPAKQPDLGTHLSLGSAPVATRQEQFQVPRSQAQDHGQAPRRREQNNPTKATVVRSSINSAATSGGLHMTRLLNAGDKSAARESGQFDDEPSTNEQSGPTSSSHMHSSSFRAPRMLDLREFVNSVSGGQAKAESDEVESESESSPNHHGSTSKQQVGRSKQPSSGAKHNSNQNHDHQMERMDSRMEPLFSSIDSSSSSNENNPFSSPSSLFFGLPSSSQRHQQQEASSISKSNHRMQPIAHPFQSLEANSNSIAVRSRSSASPKITTNFHSNHQVARSFLDRAEQQAAIPMDSLRPRSFEGAEDIGPATIVMGRRLDDGPNFAASPFALMAN